MYSDPLDHDLLLPNKFYNLIYEGHRKEEDEKAETVLGERGNISTAISSAVHKTTSETDLKELEEGRKHPDYKYDDEDVYAMERRTAYTPIKDEDKNTT